MGEEQRLREIQLGASFVDKKQHQLREKRIQAYLTDPKQRALMNEAGIDPYGPVVPGKKYQAHDPSRLHGVPASTKKQLEEMPPAELRARAELAYDGVINALEKLHITQSSDGLSSTTIGVVEDLVEKLVEDEDFNSLSNLYVALKVSGVYAGEASGLQSWQVSDFVSRVLGGDYCGAGQTGGEFTRPPRSSAEWTCAGHDVLSFPGNEAGADDWYRRRVGKVGVKALTKPSEYRPQALIDQARANVGSVLFNSTRRPTDRERPVRLRNLSFVSQGASGTGAPNPGPPKRGAARTRGATRPKAGVRKSRPKARPRREPGLALPSQRLDVIKVDEQNTTRCKGEVLLGVMTSDANSADGDILYNRVVLVTDNIFGRLALFAHAYEFFRGRFWVTYEPQVSAQTNGAVIVYFDPDVDDDIANFDPVQRSTVASQHSNAVDPKVWETKVAFRPEPRITSLAGGWLYTTAVQGSEMRLASPGRVVCINNGSIPNNTTIGKLKLGFNLQFAGANYEPGAIALGMPICKYASLAVGQTGALPFGTSDPTFTGNPNFLRYDNSFTNSRFYLRTHHYVPLRLMVMFRSVGTGFGVLAITAAPVAMLELFDCRTVQLGANTDVISFCRLEVYTGASSGAYLNITQTAATTFAAGSPELYILPFTSLLTERIAMVKKVIPEYCSLDEKEFTIVRRSQSVNR